MKKIYTLLLAVLTVAWLVLSQTANAQSYTCSSYTTITHNDTYNSIGGNEITEIEPNANDICSTEYSKVSNDITLPFNFRFCNIVTNKIKVLGNSGSVICSGSDSWPDNVVYDIYGSYYYTTQSSQQISGSSTCTGMYGYYANNQIAAFCGYLYQGWAGLTKHFYSIQGSSPFRRIVVETQNACNYSYWYDHYTNNTTYQAQEQTGSWQIVIYEGSSFISKFQVNYAPRANANPWHQGAISGFYYWIGMKGTSGYSDILFIENADSYTTAGVVPTTLYNNSYGTNYNLGLPQIGGFVMAIRYPTNEGWRDVISPTNQTIVLVNSTINPTARLSNEGQNQFTTAGTVTATIQRLGDPVSYTSTVTPTIGTQIPAPQGGIGTPIQFAPYIPTQYGIYFLTLTITNSQDLYSADNVIQDTFIVSPPNNITAIAALSPAPNSAMPLGFSMPIVARFRNIGALAQTNVPITAWIVNPLGQVVFRDTLIVGQWPSGYQLDTTFANSYTPTLKGTYTVTFASIMATDQNFTDDTTKAKFGVVYLSDVTSKRITDPDDQAEKAEKKRFNPLVFFQNVGAQDLFDVPVRLQIKRCSDNVLVFQADSIVPELNIDQGQVKFFFPGKQGNYDIATLVPGCYKLCAIARQSDDGDRTNDTICQFFSILPRLRGDYYVGVGRNFQTISNAVDTMRFRGIGGPVNLILTDNTYSENGNTTSSSQIAAVDMRSIDGPGEVINSVRSTVTWKPYPNVFPVITFTGAKPNCILYTEQTGTQSASYMTWDGNNQRTVTADAVTAEPAKRGMTLINQSTVAGSVFGMEYGRHDLKFKNLNIINNGNLTNAASAAIRMSNLYGFNSFSTLGITDTSELHHITIDNCFIGNAYLGISDSGSVPMFDVGNAFYLNRRNHDNVFSRNTIGSSSNPIGGMGLRISNEDGLRIERNEISWITGPATTVALNYNAGITVRDGNSVNLLINGNKIHNIKAPNPLGSKTIAGIDIQQGSTIYTTGTGVNAKSSTLPAITGNRVVNNMVYDLRKAASVTTTYLPMGISTINTTSYTVRNDSIFNNSFAVADAQTMVTMTREGRPFIWNNIFQNLNTSNNAAAMLYNLTVPRPARLNVSSDYNLIDFRNASLFASLSEYDEATGTAIYTLPIANLNSWRTLTQQDIHSLTGDPMFASDTAHEPAPTSYIYSPASNTGAWLGTATQATDFDGDTRTQIGGAPDMGADEFEGFQYTNDLAVLVITQPSGLIDNSGAIQVTAETPLHLQGIVRNLGGLSAPNRQVSATVEESTNNGLNWNMIYSASKVYSFGVNEQQVVDFTGPNLTQNTTGRIYRVTLSVPADQYNANNSVSKIFKIFVKRNATLISWNSSTAKGKQNRDSLISAMDRLGVKFDTLDRNSFGTNPIDYTPWWTVVWASGDPTASAVGLTPGIGNISLKEGEEIIAYLRAGQPYAKKSFIVAGQNIAQYNDPNSAFKNLNNAVSDGDLMANWLHTSFRGRWPVQNDPVALPTQFRGKLTGTGIYFVFADSILSVSPDVIQPNPMPSVTGSVGTNTSRFAYFYNNHGATPSDSGAATAWNGTNYNVVFYGFDWADAMQTVGTRDGENGTLPFNVSGTTRFLRGALDFIKSFGGTVLPVEFSSVSAKSEKTGNLVSFAVASAKNVDRYEVETLTGTDWTWAGTVTATSANTYSFLDATKGAMETGAHSYHVVAIDLDGSKTTSQTANVDRSADGLAFTMDANYPNPFSVSTKVNYTLPSAGTVSIRILDLTGKTISTEIENESMTAGQKEFIFTAANIATGTYICEIAFTDASGQTSMLHSKMTLSK